MSYVQSYTELARFFTHPWLRQNTVDPLAGIDVSGEYELIKAKTSTLPASLRKLVVARAESS